MDDRALLRHVLAPRTRHAAGDRELAAINEHADELKADAEDVLAYQVTV